MTSTRNITCMWKTIVESRSCSLFYNSVRTQSKSTLSRISSPRRNILRHGFHTTTQQQQRRSMLNGKMVSVRIHDLAARQTACNPSFRALEQRRQKHQFHNNKNEESRKPRSYESDLLVVLDMDECLIHSQFLQGPGAKYAHQVQQKGSASADTDSGTTKSVDTFNITLPDGEQVLVHERPHLRDFLREVSLKYETHIFTAAMEVYAKPVLNVLDPEGEIFSGIWYRESCQLDSSMGAYVKNLDLFCKSFADEEERQKRLNRTVLVDNNPLSFLANPEHGILVSSFYNDYEDTTLPAVLNLLHELDEHEDVRPILDTKFRLRQALEDISRGRPFSGRQQQIDQNQENESTNVASGI